ncbi:hypothetical protein Tco_0666271 [Tanacetum coccineum]
MKSSSLFMERNIEKLDHVKKVKWVDGVLLVEDRIRNLQEKVYACSHEPDLRVLKSDLEKRTATSESALKRARLNYSIAKETLLDFQNLRPFLLLSVNCSRDGDDDESTDGGSDDGSDTQSSWTKQAVDCEGPTISRSRNSEIQGVPEKIREENIKVIDDSTGVMAGELELKRPRATDNDGGEVQNVCHILRHSELSAFTRYKTKTNAANVTTGITAKIFQVE